MPKREVAAHGPTDGSKPKRSKSKCAARGDDDGEQELLVTRAALVQAAQCPVCWEVATPIYQCREGHVLCSTCLDNLLKNSCPTCRVGLGTHHDKRGGVSRNRSLEALVEVLRREPCPFAAHGCGEKFFDTHSPAAERHAEHCKHREVVCPVPGCEHRVPLSGYRDHVLREHAPNPQDGEHSAPAVATPATTAPPPLAEDNLVVYWLQRERALPADAQYMGR